MKRITKHEFINYNLQMRFKFIQFSLILTILSLPSYALAQENKSSLIDGIFKNTKLDISIDRVPDGIKTRIEKDLKHYNVVDGGYKECVFSLIPKTYRYDIFESSIKGKLNTNLKFDELKEVLKWSKNPLTGKVIDIEIKYDDNDKWNDFEEYSKNLKDNPIPKKRLKIIKNYLDKTNFIKHQVDIFMNMKLAIAMASAYSYYSRGVKIPDPNSLKLSIESQRPYIEHAYNNIADDYVSFVYQELTDEEIEEFSFFYSTDIGRKYMDSINSGMLDAYVKSSLDFGEQAVNYCITKDKSQDKTEI